MWIFLIVEGVRRFEFPSLLLSSKLCLGLPLTLVAVGFISFFSFTISIAKQRDLFWAWMRLIPRLLPLLKNLKSHIVGYSKIIVVAPPRVHDEQWTVYVLPCRAGWGIASHDILCKLLARRSRVLVISVDYRWPVEHLFYNNPSTIVSGPPSDGLTQLKKR